MIVHQNLLATPKLRGEKSAEPQHVAGAPAAPAQQPAPGRRQCRAVLTRVCCLLQVKGFQHCCSWKSPRTMELCGTLSECVARLRKHPLL